VGQIKLPPSFSDLWSQDKVSEDILYVWQRMIQSIYKRKGGEDLRLGRMGGDGDILESVIDALFFGYLKLPQYR
jgi:hypothetical protein